ncbi:DNA repair protein RecN [Leeia aquatica]|uniref:DNA repair protein RecN n=1 Tax=Leeia aquatica TaxID=2725557 RepID=A0A847S8Z9_9NEIS|nr:DNA repair protein RecN [Leeia aquatica]NLR75447.1 DNA repair protein RecN [Leeia aquatica]
MLTLLTIRDFVIVDQLELTFSSGFTVLTGETGAGKSLLIDALGLLLGGRADSTLVRRGCDKADLSAEFDLSQLPEVQTWLASQELANEPGEPLLLRRTLDRQGKSRAFINGISATVQQLRELGEQLIDIHGQHAHQSLLRADTQRSLLDAYAGAEAQVQVVRTSWQQWQQALQTLQDADRQHAEREQTLARLDWQIQELSPVALPPDALQQLLQDHARLSHAASLLEGAQNGVSLLMESEQAMLPPLHHLAEHIRELAKIDPALMEAADLLDSATIQLQEAAYSLRHYGNRTDLDPAELAALDQQLANLYATARKLKLEPAELHAALHSAQQQRLKLLSLSDQDGLRQRVQEAERDYQQHAAQLRRMREQAAEQLGLAVSDTLAQLAMASSRFSVALQTLTTPGASGTESIEYRISHHDAPAQSLARIASGGELSRVSLAIQVAMTTVAAVPTLIFDEVDVGIGGRVADIVGRLLRQLGERHQVLSITHLPQVAACGHQHWQVSKGLESGVLRSRITVLDGQTRTEEIARMLGGAQITDTTRQHAQELLAQP